MARPPKDPKMRMDTDIRIPVTQDQKRTINDAVADDPRGLAAWARDVLLSAAEKRNRKRSRR
jgi:hypothetical protein